MPELEERDSGDHRDDDLDGYPKLVALTMPRDGETTLEGDEACGEKLNLFQGIVDFVRSNGLPQEFSGGMTSITISAVSYPDDKCKGYRLYLQADRSGEEKLLIEVDGDQIYRASTEEGASLRGMPLDLLKSVSSNLAQDREDILGKTQKVREAMGQL